MKPIRSGGGKQSKRRTNRKTKKTLKQRRNHRGGAVYSFDLMDKIGGQAARKSLYKTTDSDCPMGGVNDPKQGYMYYDPLTSHIGGSRQRKSKRSKRSQRQRKH